MTDIEEIIRGIKEKLSDISVQRLQVSHPGIDDDGLWFFRRTGYSMEVQFESSSGNCPFVVESSTHYIEFTALSVGEGIRILYDLLAEPSRFDSVKATGNNADRGNPTGSGR